MNTKDYEALLATAAKYEAAPAAKKAASAPAAKKSTTSGSGRGVSGRRRPDPEPVPEPEPDTLTGQEKVDKILGPESNLASRQKFKDLELGAKGRNPSDYVFATDLADSFMFSETARKGEEKNIDYPKVAKQASSVEGMLKKYGVAVPAYLEGPMPYLIPGVGESRGQTDKARVLGEAMADRRKHSEKMYKSAVARTKALELLGVDYNPDKALSLKGLIEDARRDASLNPLKVKKALPENLKDNTKAIDALTDYVLTIAETEPTKGSKVYGKPYLGKDEQHVAFGGTSFSPIQFWGDAASALSYELNPLRFDD